MSNKVGPLHIEIGDNGYHLSSNSGEASYTLNGIPTLKVGIVDNLPDRLIITDRRSLPSALNVSAEPVLWGAKVHWEWPKEADEEWRAEIKAEYSNGETTTYQGRNVPFPDQSYQVTGVAAGKEIILTVTLNDRNGKRSKPVQLITKSSDDVNAILCDTFKLLGGQVFINEALIAPYKQSQVGGLYSNSGGVRYRHNARMKIGVNTDKAATVTDKIRSIVSGYLHGQASEYEDELVDELMAFIAKETDSTRLVRLVSEQVLQRLKQETQPGGLLHKR